MSDKTIVVTTVDGVTTLTINRPHALNAINASVMSELDDFFSEDYKKVDNLKGVIITGAGEKAFVAGADITEFAELSADEGAALSRKGQKVFFKIERFHVPVIAAVNGFALGGGCELAMCCHMRIVTDHAKFGQPEVNLGLIPGYGATQRLTQLIGKGRAMEYSMTGDIIDAQNAYRTGLANHVVAPGDELTLAHEIISKIAAKGSGAVSHVIAAINAAGSKKGYKKESQLFGKCIASDEAKEGTTAFLEKRKAEFRRE